MNPKWLVGFPCSSAGKESACSAGETWVQSLGWEDPLEKGKATHSSGYYTVPYYTVCIVHGVAKSRTRLSDFNFTSLQIINTVFQSQLF